MNTTPNKSSNPYRHFYVNGKLEFSYFYDPNITDKDKILEEFYKDHCWKFMCYYCNWKLCDGVEFSDDLLHVYLKVKEVKVKVKERE
jgi:hypothetical protein